MFIQIIAHKKFMNLSLILEFIFQRRNEKLQFVSRNRWNEQKSQAQNKQRILFNVLAICNDTFIILIRLSSHLSPHKPHYCATWNSFINVNWKESTLRRWRIRTKMKSLIALSFHCWKVIMKHETAFIFVSRWWPCDMQNLTSKR